jgi:peptide/nickel transport system permease protein
VSGKRLLNVFQGPLGVAGALILGVLFAVSVFPKGFARADPFVINIGARMQPPSRSHLFGTDELGRDLYSRVIHGTSISLACAFLVVGASGVIGTTVGTVAGYYEGALDEVMMRIADLFIAFPGLIIAMAVTALLGASLVHAVAAVILIWWPQYARLARAQVLGEKVQPYVEAARAVGQSDLNLLWKHILANSWVPLLVKATLDIGVAILMTASLSFLGLGAKPPSPELGSLVTQGREHILNAWWYSTFPGMMMFLGVLGSNLLGDSLRDTLDPTLRGA